MQIFHIVIKECPDYSLKVSAMHEKQAIQVVKRLYTSYGIKYFKQNGTKVKKANHTF